MVFDFAVFSSTQQLTFLINFLVQSAFTISSFHSFYHFTIVSFRLIFFYSALFLPSSYVLFSTSRWIWMLDATTIFVSRLNTSVVSFDDCLWMNCLAFCLGEFIHQFLDSSAIHHFNDVLIVDFVTHSRACANFSASSLPWCSRRSGT